jgi:hypothetical protein
VSVVSHNLHVKVSWIYGGVTFTKANHLQNFAWFCFPKWQVRLSKKPLRKASAGKEATVRLCPHPTNPTTEVCESPAICTAGKKAAPTVATLRNVVRYPTAMTRATRPTAQTLARKCQLKKSSGKRPNLPLVAHRSVCERRPRIAWH